MKNIDHQDNTHYKISNIRCVISTIDCEGDYKVQSFKNIEQ